MSLGSLADSSRIFVKELPRLVTRAYFFNALTFYALLFTFLLNIPVLRYHVEIILHWYSNINNCWGFTVNYSGLSFSILLGNSYHYPGPNFHISLLDLLKGQHIPVTDSVIICYPKKEVHWCHNIYLIYQEIHRTSCPDDHSILWINARSSYYFNLLRFYPLEVWADARQAWVLVSSSGGVRVARFFSWRNWWWQGKRRYEKLSIFPPVQH